MFKSFARMPTHQLLNKNTCVVFGYAVAVIWFVVTANTAVNSFRRAPAQVLTPDTLQLQESVNSKFLLNIPVPDDTPGLRDPFSKSVLVPATGKKITAQDPYGLRLKAVILSTKNGVVIEDTVNGAVYFLSEGENMDGIVLNKISKSSVTVEFNGKQITLPLAGGQP